MVGVPEDFPDLVAIFGRAAGGEVSQQLNSETP